MEDAGREESESGQRLEKRLALWNAAEALRILKEKLRGTSELQKFEEDAEDKDEGLGIKDEKGTTED